MSTAYTVIRQNRNIFKRYLPPCTWPKTWYSGLILSCTSRSKSTQLNRGKVYYFKLSEFCGRFLVNYWEWNDVAVWTVNWSLSQNIIDAALHFINFKSDWPFALIRTMQGIHLLCFYKIYVRYRFRISIVTLS